MTSTAWSASAAMEPLELRRLLSAGPFTQLAQYNAPGETAGDIFGAALATKGNLALITSSSKVVNGLKVGQVNLIDTSTGQVLRTFDDPKAQPVDGDIFGNSAVFVGNQIAISAPEDYFGGIGKVFVYSDANDLSPLEIDGVGTGNPSQSPNFGISMTTDGTSLYVEQSLDQSGLSAIYRFDPQTGQLLQTFQDANPQHSVSLTGPLAINANVLYATANIGTNSSVVLGVLEFDLTSGSYIKTLTEPAPGPFAPFLANSFGASLAVAPNGDLFVGDAEIAFQFDSSDTLIRQFESPDVNTLGPGFFGVSIAVNDQNQVAIGAPLTTISNNDQTLSQQVGAVYIFDAGDGSNVATLYKPNPTFDQNNANGFGYTLAPLPNGQFLIGDPLDDNAFGVDSGSVYVYGQGVVNQPPVADAGAAQTITENSSVTLDASGSTDSDGVADIVSYAWDLNYDGVPADFTADATGVTTPFTEDLPGTYTVAVQVTDSAGHQSIASTTVTFTDVAPTADAGPSQSVVTQQMVNFAGSGANASGDVIVNYEWDFNYDGIPANFVADATGANASNTYTANGTYTAALRVTDDDGQQVIATTTVNVNTTAIEGGVLYIGAASTGSSVTLGQTGTGDTTVNVDGATNTFTTGSIVIMGGAGNDTVDAYSAPSSVDLIMFGGAGNDSLYAGGADDVIVGGDGNDLITGGKGMDLLIGGMGGDTVGGDQNDDILIAGYTDHDTDLAALQGIMSVWTSSDTYANRVAALQNTSLRTNIDVFDDGAADVLKGCSGTDYFAFNVDQDTTDQKQFEDGATTP